MHLALALACLLALPPTTPAQAVTLIANGLAPPNPENVIVGATDSQGFHVRNEGCGTPFANSPCAAPGAATSASLDQVIGSVVVWDSSSATVTASGGFPNSMSTFGDATAVVSGSSFDSYRARDRSTLTVHGNAVPGIPTSASVADSATLELDGVSVFGTVSATGGTLLMSGGATTVSVSGGAHAALDVAAEFFGFAGQATVDCNVCGTLDDRGAFEARESAFVRWYGLGAHPFDAGLAPAALRARDSAVIEIYGSDFAIDGVAAGFGEISATQGTLTGTFSNGQAIGSNGLGFWQGGHTVGANSYTGRIFLMPIPEPSTAALVGLGLAALGISRRR